LNRRIVWLNLALVALAGVLVWMLRASWLDAGVREHAVLERRTAPKPVLAPPPLPVVKPVAPAEYIDVANKMLFSKDRNPIVVVEPPKPPPEPVMPALPNYHGQMAIGEPVILLSASNNVQRSYHAGDQVGDFKVVSFDRENIAFEWKGKSVERKLEELRPKQVVAQVPPGARPGAVPAPILVPATPKPVASLDRPSAAPAAANSAAASSAAAPASGKSVTSLGGSSTDKASTTNSADSTGDEDFYGPVLPGGMRACVNSDNSPAGTVHSGYRKVQTMSIFGAACQWEQVK
jgi:hypothetical protein